MFLNFIVRTRGMDDTVAGPTTDKAAALAWDADEACNTPFLLGNYNKNQNIKISTNTWYITFAA